LPFSANHSEGIQSIESPQFDIKRKEKNFNKNIQGSRSKILSRTPGPRDHHPYEERKGKERNIGAGVKSTGL